MPFVWYPPSMANRLASQGMSNTWAPAAQAGNCQAADGILPTLPTRLIFKFINEVNG